MSGRLSRRFPVLPQDLTKKRVFRQAPMGHRPGPGIGPRRDVSPQSGKGPDIFQGAFQNLFHRSLVEPALSPEISNGEIGRAHV